MTDEAMRGAEAPGDDLRSTLVSAFWRISGINDAVLEPASEAAHDRAERRKARGDRRLVIDRHRLPGGQSHHQKRHGDAVVEVGFHEPAAGDRAALDGEPVGADLELHSVRGKSRCDRLEPVAFLDAQFAETFHARRSSAKEAATARTGYSSIMEAAREAGTRTPVSGLERTVMSPTSSPPMRAPVADLEIGAHFEQRFDEPGARRIEHHAGDRRSRESGVDERGDDRKRRRARIGRNGDGLGLELAAAGQRDMARRSMLLDLDLRAEGLEHAFGVIARGRRLDDGGAPGDVEAGEQHRRLHLRGGDREARR